MEAHSVGSYIDKLIASFKDSDFSPENAANLPNVMSSKISVDSPYWKPVEMKNSRGGDFYIVFKQYGENRRHIMMRFSFSPPVENGRSPRELILTLINYELKVIDDLQEEIELSEIWKDYSVLAEKMKTYVRKGLELAEELGE